MRVINQEQAIQKLKIGDSIIFQTDTLPAIGCLPQYAEVIYKVKKRDKDKPLILMGSKFSQVSEYVHNSAMEDVSNLAKKYWPGPLTLVVPISEHVRFPFIPSARTLGIRVPNSSIAQSLIHNVGPLATSSANISGVLTANTADSVSEGLPDIDILGPIPWQECSGKASTIIAWLKKDSWEILRKGEISISTFK